MRNKYINALDNYFIDALLSINEYIVEIFSMHHIEKDRYVSHLRLTFIHVIRKVKE